MWRTGNGTGVVRSIYSDVVSNLHGEVVISHPVVDELKFQPGGVEVMFHTDLVIFVDCDVTVDHCDVDVDVDVDVVFDT